MNEKRTFLLFVALLLVFSNFTTCFLTKVYGEDKKLMDSQPTELGRIQWLRDYDVALETAKKLNKPLMVLFNEVPG